MAEWDRAAMVAGSILRTMGDFSGSLAELNPYRDGSRKRYMSVAALYARRAEIDRKKAKAGVDVRSGCPN
jgi:hypothetical protein